MTNETKKEVDIAEFKSLVESNHKILGLDIGSKRIGVAISTSDMTGALPLRTIKYSNMKDFLKELPAILMYNYLSLFDHFWNNKKVHFFFRCIF